MLINILFFFLAGFVVFVSLVLYWFFNDNIKKVIVPSALWMFFLLLLIASASLTLFDLPQSLIRVSFHLLVVSYFVALIIFFGMSFIVPVLLIIDLIKRHSEKTSYFAWGALWMYVTLILVFFAYDKLRMYKFEKIGTDTQLLITALENYKTDFKGYPYKLESILPEDLNNIHRTNMPGYPNLRYKPLNKISGKNVYESYKLVLDCPIGVLSPIFEYMSERSIMLGNVKHLGEWKYIFMSDTFEYWPGQDYPEKIKDARVTSLGKWIYVRNYE
ncbi:MAG: hypothetical protein A2252_02210 [Elusimicrobia bacterium RIFOXYA2_FULL_39_19]|nr:MAG: hypothetical protein A2252_02210 [Elusimicrobia bacterium RIFOXYA2_FULL_39_19]